MIKKIFFGLFLALFFAIKFTFTPYANENFKTNVNVEYKVLDDGSTTITNTISIENLKSDYYPKQYVLELNNINPTNIRAYEEGTLLKTALKETESGASIIVNFLNNSVGKGTTKTFIVSYSDDSLTQKTGEIWEILLPKVRDPENYSSYKVTLSVPLSMGEAAYISPEPTLITKASDRSVYVYEGYEKLSSGVSAGFGIFQVYAFSLKYHIVDQGAEFEEIALPPDTSTQKMIYDSIEPKPLDVFRDIDGNWIAQYDLDSDEVLNVLVKGSVQLFSRPNNLSLANQSYHSHDLLPTVYWQSDDQMIIDIASRLTTVEDIYNYVTETLNYNYERVSNNYVRYGALSALNNPNNSLCLEFTDLFIALARAKGIPAREINGFAYSQNSEVEPLSLVSDVLHSWPEYWDKDRRLWVPIDPTWGDTTGGVDFFNKLDLRHFAFVIHSENPVLPHSAGMYKNSMDPTKDVSVEFASLPGRKPLNVKIDTKQSFSLPYFSSKYNIIISNNSGSAIYTLPIKVSIEDEEYLNNLDVLLPFSKKDLTYKVNHGLLALNSPDQIVLTAGNLVENISIDKQSVIVGQLAILSLAILFIIIYFYIKNHPRLGENIKKIASLISLRNK